MPNSIQIRAFIVLCELQSENPYFWPKRHAIRTHAYWLAKHASVHPVVLYSLLLTLLLSGLLLCEHLVRLDPLHGIDARGWRRLCTSFHSASGELCVAMSLFARRLCTVFLSPDLLSPFLVCRLIALDKNPGVRPIGACVRGYETYCC